MTHLTSNALLLPLIASLAACASPAVVSPEMESPSRAAANLDTLVPLDGPLVARYAAMAEQAPDAVLLAAHYEARGCTRLTEAAVVIGARLDDGAPELDAYRDNARSRLVDVGEVDGEIPMVVVQDPFDCDAGVMPRIVTVFEVDAVDAPESAVPVESYGLLRDEVASLLERVEIRDGVAERTAISLTPATYDDRVE
ncbi:MAG: hypothetical protein AB8I08_37820 [Sandaracinaceae bacterium]